MAHVRADHLAVRRGLAGSRSAAARLITGGGLRWRALAPQPWTTATHPGERLDERCDLVVTDDAELRWVSRGGLKLEAALDRTGIDVGGRHCLDVGQSTGGFTDVLLARDAAGVVGVDVGHGQLHPRLAVDPRVVALEGVNARRLDAATLQQALRRATAAPTIAPAEQAAPRFDLTVADLSFISLALVLPALAPLAGGDVLLLVKPQFELQPADIGKGGLVRDPAAYARVEQRLREACVANGLAVCAWFDSAITGGDGNREFFIHAVPAALSRPL